MALAGSIKEQRTKSGELLRTELCAATDTRIPASWGVVTLNTLLDMATLPKEQRDPLAFKQHLASLDPQLASLKLKQRKAVQAALEEQVANARRFGASERFGKWPLEEAAPPEPPAKPRPRGIDALVLNPTPREGDGDGYRWTQSESELTITVPVPDGTSKTEVALQMTPPFGPAQRLVLRARFWPQPLLAA